MSTLKVYQARRTELEASLEFLNTVIGKLRPAYAVENNPDLKLQLEYQLRAREEERLNAARELEEVNRRLEEMAWVSGSELPAPESEPPPESAIRTCDRTTQDEQFRRHFPSLSDARPHAPQFYFIHGELWDNPDSLVLRFMDTYIRERIRKGGGEALTVVDIDPVIDWPATDDLRSRQTALCYALFRRIDPTYEGRDYSASSLRQLLLSKPDRFFVIRHNLLVKHWDWTARRLLKWYLRFWDEVKGAGPLPPCVLFVCAIYEGEKSGDAASAIWTTVERLTKKLRRGTFSFGLGRSFHQPTRVVSPRSAAHCCPSVVLDELSCVTLEEFLAWLKRTNLRYDAGQLSRWCAAIFDTDDPKVAKCKTMFHVEAKLANLRRVKGDPSVA